MDRMASLVSRCNNHRLVFLNESFLHHPLCLLIRVSLQLHQPPLTKNEDIIFFMDLNKFRPSSRVWQTYKHVIKGMERGILLL